MNNIIKSGEIMKLKDLISYEEGSIRFLRSYYRPACKMSLYKIGIFWIIIATASVRIIAIVLLYAVC